MNFRFLLSVKSYSTFGNDFEIKSILCQIDIQNFIHKVRGLKKYGNLLYVKDGVVTIQGGVGKLSKKVQK